MKLLLTGASGFIGLEVLSQALANPKITSVIALVRNHLPPSTAHPKLQTVIIQDFSTYTPSVIAELSGASACIWLIGAKTTSPSTTRLLRIDYTLALLRTLASLPTRPLRFVFVSGIVAVSDQDASVLLFSEGRKVAGQAENEVLDFATLNDGIETFVVRPAMVLGGDSWTTSCVKWFWPWSVGLKEFVSVLLDLAAGGNERRVWENGDLKVKGLELAGR